MATLAEIRAKLQALDNKTNNNFTSDRANYPFWNLQDGETCKVRFLPDGNAENTFFWVERQQIKIPFSGIKGDDENKKVTVTVPCVEMWGETCPVHQEIRPWFKDPSLEDTARTYWKKRSYIFQGIVQESPMAEEEVPENPIRKFVIGSQIFKLIKSSLMDPDFEYLPTDYINGTDFLIARSTKGSYADYSTSKWARRESALTEQQLQDIETHGLVDLSTYLPEKPNAEQLTAIFEMFEASVAGELYDPERWAKYYKPYGFEYNGSANTASPAANKPSVTVGTNTVRQQDEVQAEADDSTNEPVSTASASSTTGKSAQEILEMIRNRK
jgi:hypothetical protein